MTKKRAEIELKSKRIVLQMSRELQRTDVDDDFHNALKSLEMTAADKKAGFAGFQRLQNQIKESLKEHLASGGGPPDGLLALLTARQMRSVTQMFNPPTTDPGWAGESVKARRIQVVEDEEVPEVPEAPGHRIPDIPRLDIKDFSVDEEDAEEEWLSSHQGRSSELPREPEPEPIIPLKPAVPIRRIPSKPRPILRSDAQIQTDELEIEEVSARTPRVDTVDIGTTCRILTTPRVQEHIEPEHEEDRSQILSPISTITDISEGEVIGPAAASRNVTIVRRDGSIVFPNGRPRVVEELDEDGYFGESETDLLRATSSSPLRVVEVDMSVSSTPTRSQ